MVESSMAKKIEACQKNNEIKYRVQTIENNY